MLIYFIEGIVYIIKGVILLKNKYANSNIDKNRNIVGLKSSNNGQKNKETIDERIDEKGGTNEIKIIEVSDIKPIKIPEKNELKETVKINWIKELVLPFGRNKMGVSQVKDETLILYEKLCDFIDGELRKNKTSLNKEVRRTKAGAGYYYNILYTIYCISEEHVIKAYSGGYYNLYTYNIFEGYFGRDLRDKVFVKAQELEKCISPPKENTLIYFNLTENGLPRKWWDKDGKLRGSREFSKNELRILNTTPARTTIVWDIHEIKKQIIMLYLEIWQIISSGLEKDLKWKNKNRTALKNILDGGYVYFAGYNILASLIKVSENAIREVVPNTQILNISKEQDNIKRYFPKELVDDINNKLIEYKNGINHEELIEILNDMIKNNPSDWKLKAEKVLMAEADKRISILIDYKEDEDFVKIAKEIAKKTDDENLLLLCLYGIEREEKLSQKNAKLLKNIIHHSNISIYENILKSKEVLSLKLLNRLVKLKTPIRRKIKLNMDKVEVSKRELSETVEIVKEYIGDEGENKEFHENNFEKEIVIDKCDDKPKIKHEDFLNLILDKGSIEVEEGKKIAMDNGTLLNAFISDINQELYEYVQDQVIIIKDDYIKIDDFYVDTIKELVMSEK